MQAVKVRYLNAIGIESWVRRSSPVPVSGNAETLAAAEARADTVPAEEVVQRLAEEPVAAVRSLLDTEPGALPAAVPPPQPSSRGGPADSAARPQAPPKAQSQVTPEFRLRVLHLGGSVLLVDEPLLDPGALQAEQMHLLADLLRSARLLVHGDATGSVEHQTFYWPQVDDAVLDQGLPRAREALAYHLCARLEGGCGPVLHVIRGADLEAGSGGGIARDSMAGLDAMVLEVGAELLDLQAPGSVRAQVWAELCSLVAMRKPVP